MQRKYSLGFWMAVLFLFTASCRSHYEMSGIERSRILIDGRYAEDKAALQYLLPYRHMVDSVMSPVVGQTARYMAANRPESELSNLLADILVWAAKAYNEKPDFGVYNMGGIRAAFAKGKVSYGDVLDVAPFENKIAFVTLTGEKVLELFRQMAITGGEAVSHGVELVFTNDHKLKSARLHGKEINTQANYRVVSIDYVIQGNDKLEAFKSKTDVVSPKDESNNVRNIICDYFREQTAQGKSVDSQIEGRIIVE